VDHGFRPLVFSNRTRQQILSGQTITRFSVAAITTIASNDLPQTREPKRLFPDL
jgi:hypothetical protein